jgi:hypothetical protein
MRKALVKLAGGLLGALGGGAANQQVVSPTPLTYFAWPRLDWRKRLEES